MTAQLFKELYNSPNGDQWTLSKDAEGKLVVVHRPNKSSGGRTSEIAVEVFLSQGGHGPEHQALLRELASRGDGQIDFAPQELSVEQTEKLSRALGQAVARCWSRCSQEVQHELFEAALTSEGELIRQQLAVFMGSMTERSMPSRPKPFPRPTALAVDTQRLMSGRHFPPRQTKAVSLTFDYGRESRASGHQLTTPAAPRRQTLRRQHATPRGDRAAKVCAS
jgi:hypothetical protein